MPKVSVPWIVDFVPCLWPSLVTPPPTHTTPDSTPETERERETLAQTLAPTLTTYPSLPPVTRPTVSRNLAVTVCDFPAYFAPCLFFRVAGDGNWQRQSSSAEPGYLSPVCVMDHLSQTQETKAQAPPVYFRKEDFVAFWRDHLYAQGRRHRLCGLLRHYQESRTVNTQRICTAALRVLILGLVNWHPDLASLRKSGREAEQRIKHYVSMVIATMQASISRSAACITASDILNSNLVDSFYLVQDFLTSAFELLSVTRFEAAHQVWKEMLKHEEEGRGARLKKSRPDTFRLKCGCGDHSVAGSDTGCFDEEYVTINNQALRRRLRLNYAVIERIFDGYAKPLASAYERSIGFEVGHVCLR